MAQQLRATMEFQTGQAIANARNFVGVLQNILGTLQQVQSISGQVTANLRNMTAATQGTFGQLTAVTNTVNQNFNTVNNTVNTYNQNIREAGERTGGFANTVTQWVGRFVALETANRLISSYVEKLKEATELQRKFGGEQLDRARITQEVVNNVPAWAASPEGERKAQGAIRSVMERAGVPYEQAANVLATAAGSAGKDISARSGQDYAVSLAQLVRRENLDDSATLAVSKILQQRGQDTPQGMDLAFAKGLQLQAVTPGVKKAPFWRGLAAATVGGIARGQDADTVDAIYSSMIGEGISEQDAANQTRMILTLSQGTNVKARHFGAQQAAKLGVITPSNISEGDIPGMAFTGDKGALKITREEAAIAAERTDIEGDAKQHVRGDSAAQANRQRGLDERRRKLKDREEALAISRQEFVAATNEKRLDDAYMAVSPKDRLERVTLPTFFGASTDEDRNRIVQSVGGMFSRTDAAFKLASPAGQAQFNRARAALGAARPSDTVRANEIFETTTAGQLTRRAAQQDVEDVAASNPGTAYAELLFRDASRERDRNVAAGKYVPDADSATMDKVLSFASNPSKQIAEIGWKKLVADAGAEYRDNPDPEMYQLYQRIWTESQNPANFSGASSMLTLQRLSIALGQRRESMARSKRIAAETAAAQSAPASGPGMFPSGAAPSTQPAPAPDGVQASPATSGPQSRATIINNHYSIGNYVPGGTGAELPGPLDGMG